MSELAAAPVPEKVKEVAVNPEATLELRPKDVAIPIDQLMQVRDCIGLFLDLKSKPSVEKWPGTLVIRRYHPGEVICQQGEAGSSAFYVLTDADEDRLRTAKILGPKHTMVDIHLGDEALSVHLAIPRSTKRSQKWWEKIADRFSKQKTKSGAQTRFIPIDAPTGVDYETRRASLSAGDLFGEMSCLYRTPRSATVVAERDCYVIELLRNVLDQLKRDPKFREEMDRKYKERVFALQVLNLPLFQNLPEEHIAWLRDRAALKSYKAGQIICDEHDVSDDMFIIRSGLVKVSQGASALYGMADVLNWPGLIQALKSPPDGSVLAAIRNGLSDITWDEPADTLLDTGPVSDSIKLLIMQALNDRVKGGPIADEFKTQIPRASYAEFSLDMPAAKDRTDAETRRLNRVFLDGQLGGAVRTWRLAAGPESILRYASRGDLIGEMGVMLGRPRSATCVAYVHSRTGQAREDVKSTDEEVVELVHIPAEVFLELLDKPGAEKLRAQVENLIAERQLADIKRREVGTGSATGRRISPEFERLGLIQGQKLMLVDLDRCTRCDECVRACADTHDDGRSRLFLEGPRFEHYLVPLTCRSCLDPVCMIGCPVGSIHRGDNKQMVIEDWCIGCGMCAKQCPYGSIQMHDEGIIPGSSRGWLYRGDAGGTMQAANSMRGSDWVPGKTPIRRDRDFRRLTDDAEVVWLVRDFQVTKELLSGEHVFELKLTAPDEHAQVFINGRPLETKEKMKRDFSRLFPIDEPAGTFRAGINQVQIRVTIPQDRVGELFDLRLDSIEAAKRSTTQAVEYVNKSVAFRAVVCDLCSTLPGQVPSCVNACPHEAAMRVDARSNFPVG